MRRLLAIILGCAVLLAGCTGAETLTKKRWENKDTTIRLVNLSSGSKFGEPGQLLGLAIEDALDDSAFIVTDREAHYQLKYKIMEYQKGSRWKRMATLGIDESSRAMMKVKVGLFGERGMLAAWEIDSWVNGGPVGGSESSLYEKAAEQIFEHLKGY